MTLMLPSRPSPIALPLDRRNPFEALILNDLERRPAERQTEWLRQLLVRGFLSECRALRDLQSASDARVEAPATPEPPAWRPTLAVTNPNPPSPPPAPTPPEDHEPDETGELDGFAVLRKVIG